MHYLAHVTREGRATLAKFPDCPGCQTFAEPSEDILVQAREALEGWLEAHLQLGELPPRPADRKKAPRGASLIAVPVPAGLAAALSIRWARAEAGLSQAELARRAGVSQQQIAKLEAPGANPTVGTLERVARALGVDVDVGLTCPA